MQLDLFEYAKQNAPAFAAAPPRAWEEPGVTLWGRAWLANVHRLCHPANAAALAFAEKLLASGRLQSCRVRGPHAQAAFTNPAGGTVLVNLAVRPLEAARWRQLESLCDSCGEGLFSSDELPEEVVSQLFGQPDGLLPELRDLRFSCSHCRWPFCLYRAATLVAVAAELDRAPVKLFELRGAAGATLLVRSAQQTGADDDLLPACDLSALFGIDVAAAGPEAEGDGRPPKCEIDEIGG